MDLARDHEVVAFALDGPAEDRLRLTDVGAVVHRAIDVGAIEERDPSIDRGFDESLGFGLVRLPTKPEAECDSADFYACFSEVGVFHLVDPLSGSVWESLP